MRLARVLAPNGPAKAGPRPLWIVVGLVASVGLLAAASAQQALPRLVDVGASECIPCKLMAPILEDLKKACAGRLDVAFVDVEKDPTAQDKYRVTFIPTQIFYSPAGKELFRHTGFMSKEDILAKWKELGVDLGPQGPPPFARWEPAQKDTRPKDAICYMCDADVNPRTKVTVKTDKGDVNLCSPHCYFIMYSCLTADRASLAAKTSVTDWASGNSVPLPSAVYLHSADEATGRPVVKAFADRNAALAERGVAGGTIVSYAVLQNKELAARCGFCDRAVYPEDAALVKVDGLFTWGCCSHCAMGVAARTGKNIEVHQPDRLTGQMVVVKTFEGKIASIEPPTAVAWFGQRTKPDGTHASAGCFHQGFFVSPENLRKWVEANPFETGEMITIAKALADKMALSPQQITKACKIGECAPK